MYTRLYEHSTDKLTRARLYFSKSFSNLSVPETFRSETKKRFADQKTKGFLFSPDLCPRRKMERSPFRSSLRRMLIPSLIIMIISQAGLDVSLHERGGWSLKFARALIPFRLRARQSYPPLAEYTHKRERKREIDRERDVRHQWTRTRA